MDLTYLDYNATTPVAPEVLEAMLPFLRERWGNPSSAYSFGHSLGACLDQARQQVAALIHAEPREIVFTSCGTESINAVLHSSLLARPGKRHIVTTAVEHSATLKCCAFLQKQGFEISHLPVDNSGALNLDQLRDVIRPDTAVVSVMWANNETGILFPVKEVGEICRTRGVLFHSDAVQAAGKVPVDALEANVDFLSMSAHKLCAPKGVGALYVKRGVRFQPWLWGGGQERGRRGGTENVAGIIAFGRAAELAASGLESEKHRLRSLRDQLEAGVLSRIPGVQRNGPEDPRLPNTSNLSFEGVEAEGILLLLDREGVCASSGSACTTGSLEASHVLTAMGISPARARSSLRFSLGRFSTRMDVEHALSVLPPIIEKLRKYAPRQETGESAEAATL